MGGGSVIIMFTFGAPSLNLQKMMALLLLLLTVNPAYSGYSWSHPAREAAKSQKEVSSKQLPVFDESINTEVFVMLGQTVYLPCTVRHLGDKLVSWIKTRDLHILTSGKHTFTADPRVSVVVAPETDTWSLKIRSAKASDSGKYECQVNTDPKMSSFFILNVGETPLKDSPPQDWNESTAGVRAAVAGPREQVVRPGSTVTLECRLAFRDRQPGHSRFTTRAVPNVQWLKDGLAVSFQAERGGISVETERGERSGSSRLTVASVGEGDAGRYTCSGQGVAPDTVILHVIDGEHTEAMQRDQSSGSSQAHRHQPFVLRIPAGKTTNAILQITILFLIGVFVHSDWWHMDII